MSHLCVLGIQANKKCWVIYQSKIQLTYNIKIILNNKYYNIYNIYLNY